MRQRIVGVMGSGSRVHRRRSTQLGAWLGELGVHLLTGGGGGVMSAVSEAFSQVPLRRGRVIGVLPAREGEVPNQAPNGYPNPWVEIVLQTHLPLSGLRGTENTSRNHINVLSSDVIVALPGGDGTSSEVRLALQYAKPLMAFLENREEIPDLPREVKIGRFPEIRGFVEGLVLTD